MSLYEFEGKRPQIDDSAFVHPESILIGNVRIGKGCYVGPGAVLRADWGEIGIGEGSNVQENCVIHAAPDKAADLGPASHIGHGAIVHGAKLGHHVTVGMRAILDEEVVVGDGSIIGAACFVPRGTIFPAYKIIVGVPAKVVGDVTKEKEDYTWWATQTYQGLPPRYHSSLRKID